VDSGEDKENDDYTLEANKEDETQHGANLSGLTSKRLIALLALIRKQLNFRYHPLNLIAQCFSKVMIAHLELK